MTGLFPRAPREIAPGAAHVPGWLSLDQQIEIAAACREWARGPAPMRHTRLPRGGVMSVQTVCLGWHWTPYQYSRTADDVNGERVPEVPEWLVNLGRDAVQASYGADWVRHVPGAIADPQRYTPDAVLINFYEDSAKMGMHQDKEEVVNAPVVSISIGDRAVFRFGNTTTRGKPYTDVHLESGDLFVFGGPSRFAYHAVPKVEAGTAPPGCPISTGRLNLTLRQTGLED